MAYRGLSVIELREVLRRFCLGEGLRPIARGTGLDRKTVGRHVTAGIALGLRRGGPPPTDEQVAAVRAAVRAARRRWARACRRRATRSPPGWPRACG